MLQLIVWLRSGAHADVEGAEVARVLNQGPIKVRQTGHPGGISFSCTPRLCTGYTCLKCRGLRGPVGGRIADLIRIPHLVRA